MATLFRDATLVQFDPPQVDRGDLRVAGARIAGIGANVTARDGDEIVACDGAVLMPGLVNGHTHLYSALAPGMPAPPRPPCDFHEILRFVWWRLDRAHTLESVEVSGLVGAAAALRCGTTTLIDHHASPSCIEGSLDALERGIAAVGPRAVLCYETTDRNGADGARLGLAENERYVHAARSRDPHRFAGMVGAHASFTLEEASLEACVDLARRSGIGIHIHAAEDPVDERITRQRFGDGLLERFRRHGLLEVEGTIIAHGTHFGEAEIAAVNELAGALSLAHAPRSNMNNGVGYTPAVAFSPPPMLGTDGIDEDMWAEAVTALFKSHDAHRPVPPARVLGMLGAAARRASSALGLRLGVIAPGAAADLVLTDYRPASPLDADSLAAHVVYALGAQHVHSVMVDGTWRMRARRMVAIDEPVAQRRSIEVARALHERMAEIPVD